MQGYGMLPNQPSTCASCNMKAVVAGTPFCSRRCSWTSECRCPHCGRMREGGNSYCSSTCRSQALQANWCPICGICQITTAGSCSNSLCPGSAMFLCHDNRTSKQRFGRPHESLPDGHPGRSSLNASFAAAFAVGMGCRVIQVLKLSQSAFVRKRYLSHRSTVEASMSLLGMQKYGHGGEGNEQKRYFPLTLRCRASEGVPFARSCSPSCDFCSVLSGGLNLHHLNRVAHYCSTTVAQGLAGCIPNAYGQRALLVARVIVGNPEVIPTSPFEQPELRPPTNPDVFHSVVLSTGDLSQDATFVFRDEAVDPLYVVLVE